MDTSVALVAVETPERLSAPILKALEEGPVVTSILVFWEVVIKSMKGTLDVGDPRQWWAEMLDALATQPLLYRPEHIGAVLDLPPLHQDPFDRGMIAQAIVEDLTFVTTDSLIAQYAGDRLRVLR